MPQLTSTTDNGIRWTTEDLDDGAVELYGSRWFEVRPHTWLAERYGYTGPVEMFCKFVQNDPGGEWEQWEGGLWIPSPGHEHAQRGGYVLLYPGAFRIELKSGRWVTVPMGQLTPLLIEGWAEWMIQRRGQGEAYLRDSLVYEMVPEIRF